MAGQRKLRAQATGTASGELLIAGEETLVAVVKLADGQWTVERKLGAGDSTWALPQPAQSHERAPQS